MRAKRDKVWIKSHFYDKLVAHTLPWDTTNSQKCQPECRRSAASEGSFLKNLTFIKYVSQKVEEGKKKFLCSHANNVFPSDSIKNHVYGHKKLNSVQKAE